MYDLGKIKWGWVRNLAKMSNEVELWAAVEGKRDWRRLKRDKDSHALVEMRVNFHRTYGYTSGHWAFFRDAVDIALATAVVYLIVHS